MALAYGFELADQGAEHIVLQNGENIYFAQYVNENTHVSTGFYDTAERRYRRGMGGVLVLPGHLLPNLLSYFIYHREAARSEGYVQGSQATRGEFRKALGL